MTIEVYTDGSATTKDKPGGWAYVLVRIEKDSKGNSVSTKIAECGGHMANASNNDAEMEAAIQGLAAALKLINQPPLLGSGMPGVELCSDSQLVLGWASGRYRFKQMDKIAKYQQLQFLVKRLNVTTRWVEGHSGHEHNERCDKLANEARRGVNRQKERAEAIASGNTLIGNKKAGTICVWYKNCLKVIDLETNLVENYDRAIHGPRGGVLEIREEKSR